MVALSTITAANATPKPTDFLHKYDIVWNTPSVDARGSMPLGNGEVTVNAWVEADKGLRFLIGRSDSFSEIGRILKLGQIGVDLSPNPFTASDFSQHVHLHDGCIDIHGHGVDLRLFLDPDKPVVYVEGKSSHPVTATVEVESWRTSDRTIDDESAWSLQGAPRPLVESADHFPKVDGGLAWYHRNESTYVPDLLQEQGLLADSNKVHDPLRHRTFGGYVHAPGFDAKDERTLASKPSMSFTVAIACPCRQSSTEAWLKEASTLAKSANAPEAFGKNVDWWHGYWNRSYIDITSAGNKDAELLTRGFVLQRFMQACDSRGTYPAKFNGGTLTVGRDGKFDDNDYRRWGDPHWYQNLRHLYHPMMESGDIDMTDPFFELYERVVPLAEARSKRYENVDGVFFPETMTAWGTYAGKDYVWDRTGHPQIGALTPWWSKTRNQGPEIVDLMLDRWDYTQDSGFLKHRLLPMAVDVLTYFDQRYARDAAGRIVLEPTQAVETFWDNVVNDMPTIASLRSMCTRLNDLPSDLVTPDQQTLFKRMLAACPELPMTTHVVDGRSVPVLAPAEKHEDKRNNVENPEMYAVWPARLYGIDKPGLQMARDSYAVRVNHLTIGWCPDGNCAAVLGLSDECARIVETRCENSNKDYRWPATWGPNFDWLPDQNHGGNLLNTMQMMLLQSDGHKILLCPAWPKDWNATFKLHAAYRTTVEATIYNGKVTHLKVTPDERAKDVVNYLK